jgi:hypothetical protein
MGTPRVVALLEPVLPRSEGERLLRRLGELDRDTYARLREYLETYTTPQHREALLKALDREMTFLGELRRRFVPPPSHYASGSV